MARQELNSGDIRIEQLDAIEGDLKERPPEIVRADASLIDSDYANELNFMADWVTIRLEPGQEENASPTFPVWINGRGAEMLINDRAFPVAHLPVGEVITVRRSAVEIIARSKTMKVQTEQRPDLALQLRNGITRKTSQTQMCSVIHDPNPKGAAWYTEIVRRSF